MQTIKRLIAYAPERKVFLVLALVISGIATVLSFVPYWLLWQLLREATGAMRSDTMWVLAWSVAASTCVYALVYMAALLCSHVFAFRLETNLKARGLEALLQASFSFFDTNPSGRTRKIIDDNTSQTHTIVAHILPDSINALVFPICLLVLAFMNDVLIGGIMVGAILISAVCFKFMYGEGSAAMMAEYLASLENINSETVEYVRGIQVIKVFNAAVESFERLHHAIVHYADVVNRQCQSCRVPFNCFQALMLCLGAFVIPVAFIRAQGGTPIPHVVSDSVYFLTFVTLLLNAFMKIMFFQKNEASAKDALDKLENLFNRMQEHQLPSGTVTTMSDDSIDFCNVSFAYEGGAPILSDFSLSLEGGKHYALVGPSGGGKSTIAKLISGFYPPTSGEVRIGGVGLANYAQDTLHKSIAFVFQHAQLFNRSIFDNVLIGRPDATHDEVMQALSLACCDDILNKFPERERTVIGAQGVHLSGGETQRIAVARALLKDAAIVVLDEASAAADPENEYEMQQAFASLMKNKTVIMIAHRLSSIRDVDEILFVEEGRVVERGSHDELVAAQGRYWDFLNLYRNTTHWRLP